VEGKEIQPVAALPDVHFSLIVWRVRGVRAGEFECVVRSSTGLVQSKKIKVSAAVE
jgi:hypothetical protein